MHQAIQELEHDVLEAPAASDLFDLEALLALDSQTRSADP